MRDIAPVTSSASDTITEPYGSLDSVRDGNVMHDWAEVSRGHSSQSLTVMGETGRRAEL